MSLDMSLLLEKDIRAIVEVRDDNKNRIGVIKVYNIKPEQREDLKKFLSDKIDTEAGQINLSGEEVVRKLYTTLTDLHITDETDIMSILNKPKSALKEVSRIISEIVKEFAEDIIVEHEQEIDNMDIMLKQNEAIKKIDKIMKKYKIDIEDLKNKNEDIVPKEKPKKSRAKKKVE